MSTEHSKLSLHLISSINVFIIAQDALHPGLSQSIQAVVSTWTH